MLLSRQGATGSKSGNAFIYFNMIASEWKKKAQAEIQQAIKARQAGNEGKARVCARRAAGIIIGEYLRRQGTPPTSASAILRLQHLQMLPEVAPRLREVAGYFLARVTPEHTLPVEADLVKEVQWLGRELLGEEIGVSGK
jgi:hypothetical protein